MPMRSGCCTACGAEVWKTVAHPKTGERILLWPRPSSRYATIEAADGSTVRGVAYCGTCGPEPYDAPPPGITVSVWADGTRQAQIPVALTHVTGYDRAMDRYAAWYSPAHGEFLQAWLRDHVNIDILGSGTLTKIMAEWNDDRRAQEIAGLVAGERDDGRPTE